MRDFAGRLRALGLALVCAGCSSGAEPVRSLTQALDAGTVITGAPCSSATECASGNCVDGVCCDQTCNGKCQACTQSLTGDTTKANGTCTAVLPAVNDTSGDCVLESTATCGQTGRCDGAGNCQLYPAGAACGSKTPACAGNIQLEFHACDGKGGCIASIPVDCAPAKCVGGLCATPCSLDTDCLDSAYCAVGVCTPKKALAVACAKDSECTSQACVDGVCCESVCAGVCERCEATSGKCVAVAAGEDPDEECATGDECGNTGACDGARACELVAPGQPCGTDSCVGAAAVSLQRCDGFGTCTTNAESCGKFACRNGACLTQCMTNDDCSPGDVCNAESGICASSSGKCSDDVTFIANDGTVQRCEPFACASDGCLTLCKSAADCAPGNKCSADGSCKPPAKGAADEGGCGVAPTPKPSASWLSWLLLVPAMLMRRRNRSAHATGRRR